MREADLVGVFDRKAWRSRLDHKGSARLDMWLVHVPGGHPHWDRWAASIVHLRPESGTPEAYKRYPQAEYEVSVFALDPRSSPLPDGDDWTFLMPADLVFQFHGVSDADARAILSRYVEVIVKEGIGSPDSDYRVGWEEWLAAEVAMYINGRKAVM